MSRPSVSARSLLRNFSRAGVALKQGSILRKNSHAGHSVTVAGLLMKQLGRLPRRGDTVSADGYSIRVESVRENRIEAVRIRERRPTPAGSPGERD